MRSALLPDGSQPPRVLPGFEHIGRYYDPTRQMMTAKILPGELYVTTQDEAIVTVLGSCVSACIWDRAAGIGGMNHFMLPTTGEQSRVADFAHASEAARYGSFAMEALINAILKFGGRRAALQIKIVGGGRVLRGSTDVGARNIEFVREFIRNEGLNVLGEHVGGVLPRKVWFHPLSGRALVKELKSTATTTVANREQQYASQIGQDAKGGDIELF
ncbi:MAG TPA: chemoreceptor glutamine deamidase CheD [Gammaproteobacteria bacterium]|nr:chemoreceptor glutamine deamidase CheD [Gammaproteobacteria bacterium]